MKGARKAFLLLLMGASSDHVFGYDTQTHALITREAYARSSLVNDADNSIRHRTALNRLHPYTVFNVYWQENSPAAYYLDGGSNSPATATDVPDIFEKCQMRAFLRLTDPPREDFGARFADTVESNNYTEILPIQNWLVRGAIREDDMGDEVGWLGLYKTPCMKEWFATIDKQPGQITRSFRHFFDPYFDKGLSLASIRYPRSVDWALGNYDSFAAPPSEATGNLRSTFSYRDARNAYWWALTRKKQESESGVTSAAREADAVDRTLLWATVFRSLGNVVHLLQDAAQPQHSRVDTHSALDSPQEKAFEGFTNARILGGGDIGEFARGFYGNSFNAAALSVPPLGTYGSGTQPPLPTTIQFATPVRFFTTRQGLDSSPMPFSQRAGLADYSNRGFFTGGTLPGMEDTPHPAPPQDFDDPQNGYTLSYSPCEAVFEVDPRISNATCLHFKHVVPDPANPAYASSGDLLPQGHSLPNAPIAAEGIFRGYVIRNGLPAAMNFSKVTWSPTVIETIGNLTIPRAIGYSAGLLDFFFRGEIELSSPPDGLYAVVDQGKPHHTEDGIPMDAGGRPFGFEKVRVRVRNTTALNSQGQNTFWDSGSKTLVPQTMRAGLDASGNPTGHLVAIARYHRNACYQQNLSGEFVVMPNPFTGIPDLNNKRIPSGCAIADARSAYPEISVSAPLSLDAEGNLPGPGDGATNPCVNAGNINSGAHGAGVGCENESALAEFDFSDDPIPINATDLFLQVAYRGPLGLEDDGIAVGMKDIHETNYFTMWNGTDWFYRADEWVVPDDYPELGPGDPWEPYTIRELNVCFAFQSIAVLGQNQVIEPAEFLRVGVLSDASPVPFGLYAKVHYGLFMPRDAATTQRQTAYEDAAITPYAPQPFFWYGRGTVLGGNFVAPFFATVFSEEVDNTMQSLILQPDIGGTSAGIARPITVGFEAFAHGCRLTPPPVE